MKKLLIAGLAIVMVFGFAACDGDKTEAEVITPEAEVITPENKEAAPPVTEDEPIDIQVEKEPVVLEEGFQELFYKDSYSFIATEDFTLTKSDVAGDFYAHKDGISFLTIMAVPFPDNVDDIDDIDEELDYFVEGLFKGGECFVNEPYTTSKIYAHRFTGFPASSNMFMAGIAFVTNGEINIFYVSYNIQDQERAFGPEELWELFKSINPL